MTTARKKRSEKPIPYYQGANIPMAVIRRYAKAVAECFGPERIILFGSFAYGTPHEDSDVDLLVVMPTRNQLDQAFRIRSTVPTPFPMDLIVRTPEEMRWRLEEGDSFLREITTRGKVLHEKDNRRVGRKSRRGPSHRPHDAEVSNARP